MKNLKKLTILHSNDMHGDFLAEQIDERLVGGVSLLSGYVNKVRREEKNVIYAVAGDMFRGSVIDSEYKGTSTIGIMNLVGRTRPPSATTRSTTASPICCFWKSARIFPSSTLICTSNPTDGGCSGPSGSPISTI